MIVELVPIDVLLPRFHVVLLLLMSFLEKVLVVLLVLVLRIGASRTNAFVSF